MRSIDRLICLGIFSFAVTNANAISIGVGDFSGSETVVDLSLLPGPAEPVVTVGDLVFTSTANFLKQSGLTETSDPGMFSMDLATPQLRVGLELRAFANATDNVPVTWSIQAFDDNANPLETIQVSQAAAGDAVFGGIERAELIARLVVSEVTPPPTGSNYFTFINEARFETPIPEPSAVVLALLGCGLVFRRHR